LILPDAVLYEILPGIISPYDPERVQPASYDVALGPNLKVFTRGRHVVDPRDPVDSIMVSVVISEEAPYLMEPGDFLLGATAERIQMPHDLVAKLEGRSTIGRLAVEVHKTAGHIDPGFGKPDPGNVTLEIKNDGPLTIILTPGLIIGQLIFFRMLGNAMHP
jgi:dCTP deaminase